MRREDLAHAMANAVTAVPGVAGLHPGFGVEVATYFTGGKVTGIRLAGERVEVYLVVKGRNLRAIADAARAAAQQVLTAAGDQRPADIVVADIAAESLDRRGATVAVMARSGHDAGS